MRSHNYRPAVPQISNYISDKFAYDARWETQTTHKYKTTFTSTTKIVHRFSTPPTILPAPQGSGSVLPQLTRQQHWKCLASQEKLLTDLFVQNFDFNFKIQYILASTQDIMHQAGMLDQDSINLYLSEIVLRIAYLDQGTLRTLSRTLPNARFVELEE